MSILLYFQPKHVPETSLFVAITTLLAFAYFFLSTDVFDEKTQILIACAAGGATVIPILLVAYELAVE